jgi:hypothetical protein
MLARWFNGARFVKKLKSQFNIMVTWRVNINETGGGA